MYSCVLEKYALFSAINKYVKKKKSVWGGHDSGRGEPSNLYPRPDPRGNGFIKMLTIMETEL